jgi:outer membrane protein
MAVVRLGERTAVLNTAKPVSTIANIAFTAAHQQVVVYKVFYSYAATQAYIETLPRAYQSMGSGDRRGGALLARHWNRGRRCAGTSGHRASARGGQGRRRLQGFDRRHERIPSELRQNCGNCPRHLSAATLEPIDRIVSEALARRPEVSGAYAAHEASVKKLCAAKAEFMPNLFLSGTITSGLSADCDIQSGSYRPGGGICA